VGGERVDRGTQQPKSVSLVLLNRGGKFNRPTLFSELEKLDVAEIVSVESSSAAYDVESLARSYTNVRFLLLERTVSTGELVNLAIQESSGRYVLVIWNDMRVPALSRRVVERAQEDEVLCTVPLMRSPRLELIPTVMAPGFHGSQLKVLPSNARIDNAPSLYPYDYVGLYNREKFLFCGGYDGLIPKSYWQKLDFGFRCFMWGETIRCNVNFKVNCLTTQEPEDTTPEESYKRFFLKNLSVRFHGDQGVLPFSRFLPFWLKTSGGLFESYRFFRTVQEWVERNRYLFKQDARRVTEMWEMSE
jgi:hypothetical protein